jgi:preprotein translocase subunit SecA
VTLTNLDRRTRRALAHPLTVLTLTEGRLPALRDLTDAALQQRYEEAAASDSDDALADVVAVVAESIRRSTGLQLRTNQILCAVALCDGTIAELATGEGKTLAALPSAAWLALDGNGVHVLTANDYLAERDASLAADVLGRLGLTVGTVYAGGQPRDDARAAYACDVTYGTANAVGFDFLRDRLASDAAEQVCRPRYAAIVDEADQILIDEARTPLIISGEGRDTADLAERCFEVVADLEDGVDFDADEVRRVVALTQAGIERAGAALGVDLVDPTHLSSAAAVRQALVARTLMKRDRDYVVVDGEVHIIDANTGRAAAGRRWSDGLHQAIEAKERLNVQPDHRTLASVTLQRYFGGYQHLSGMTGTAAAASGELSAVYGLDVVAIPTHAPSRRIDHDDVVFVTATEKLQNVAEFIAEEHAVGRPVLVGTPDITESEALSALLNSHGVPHQVLNAKNHREEAAVIAQAGRPGAVVVSTSMAGRGVDILLGGDPDALAAAELSDAGIDVDAEAVRRRWADQCAADAEQVRSLGGLLVVGTSRQASRRIDDQLRGRSGRQGDPGESQFCVALDDEVLRPYVGGAVGKLAAGLSGPIAAGRITKTIAKAQATLTELHAAERQRMLDYDEVRATQADEVWRLRDATLHAAADDLWADVKEYAVAVGEYLADRSHDDEAGWDETVASLQTRWAADVAVEDLAASKNPAALLADLLYTRAQANLADLDDPAAIMRHVMVGIRDVAWVEHNEFLNEVRDGIGLRSMAQEDPLVAWRYEAVALYQEMELAIAMRCMEWLCRMTVTITPTAEAS